MDKKTDILGIKISRTDREQALESIKDFLRSQKTNTVITPNPEIILKAIKDEELFFIVNSADLALPDGFGLKLAALLSGQRLKRVTGADISKDILEIAEKKGSRVAIINRKDGLSSKTDIDKAIKYNYPKLEFLSENLDINARELSRDFLDFKPEIVFVNFGAPHQEKFIHHVLGGVKDVRVALGVGGSFDYITGQAKRAPKLLRTIGLEWFWRLLLKPSRIGRIFNAVFVFTFKFLRHKYFRPLFYRPNVACLLYKKEKDKYKILIVERRDEKGEWQLPQGGRDGQNLIEAGARELKEELNCDKFIPKRAYKNVHKYKFGTRKGETSCRAESKRKHTGFKGQKQGLFIAEFTGKDEEISINFWDHASWKWVDSEKLVDSVHFIRKRATQRFLRCFDEYVKTEEQ